MMNGNAFDIFTRCTEAVSRRGSLRTLGAALAALAGVSLSPESGTARKKSQKLRTVCHCPDQTVTNCRTLKKGKKAVKKHLEKHQCDYKGACTGFNPCGTAPTDPPPPPSPPGPIPECTSNAECRGQVCVDGTCQNCTLTSQCVGGEICIDEDCIGGTPCTNADSCDRPLVCSDPGKTCVLPDQGFGPCSLTGECQPGDGVVTACFLGMCVALCTESADCQGETQCEGGLCLFPHEPN
jgi:hypothetical protein